MEAEIRKLTRKAQGDHDSDDERQKKKPKKSYLEEEMAKYENARGVHAKGKGKDGKRKARDEDNVLAALSSFRSKLQRVAIEPERPANTEQEDATNGGQPGELGEVEEAMEVDNDVGFMAHALHFAKDNTEEVIKAERDYEVIDPRQRGARAREEEKERRRAQKPRDNGRGFRPERR